MHVNNLYLAQNLERRKSNNTVVGVVVDDEGQWSLTWQGETISTRSVLSCDGKQLLLHLLDNNPKETAAQLLRHHFCPGASLSLTPKQLWTFTGERQEWLPSPAVTLRLSPVSG